MIEQYTTAVVCATTIVASVQHNKSCTFPAMTFGERITLAMQGRYKTDAALAEALTRLLRSQGRLAPDEVIPEQTIQSVRTRIKNLSQYTLDIAKVCGVDPYWLAFEIGDMVAPPVAVSSSERDLLNIWKDLGPERREKVWEYLVEQRALGSGGPFTENPSRREQKLSRGS